MLAVINVTHSLVWFYRSQIELSSVSQACMWHAKDRRIKIVYEVSLRDNRLKEEVSAGKTIVIF